MGMFDDIQFNCPVCGRPNCIQTKALTAPQCDVYSVGDKIKSEVDVKYIPTRYVAWPELWDCVGCGSSFVVDFSSGKVNIEVWDGKEELFIEPDGYQAYVTRRYNR